MHIVCAPEAAVPSALRTQVRVLQDLAWPPAADDSRVAELAGHDGHDPVLQPLSMLLVDDAGTVLAALDILTKNLVHARHRLTAAGLSTVVTRPAVRGRGHGRRLVTAARTTMRSRGADVGLFTCDRPLQHFYTRAGWEVLPGTVLVGGTPSDPFPSDRPGFDKVTMGAFFTPSARRARPSFVHARVALHPGSVDKLW
jgi:GNAT superfamily N-acetyltransferase